jgi:RNA polymerase-binding transcription factor DksA
METAELQRFDGVLAAMEKTLSARLTGSVIEETQTSLRQVSELCDTAMLNEALDIATSLGQNDLKLYQSVRDARQRIRDGIFGICLESLASDGKSHPIALTRLSVMPYAENCIQCQRQVEARQPKPVRNVPRDWAN